VRIRYENTIEDLVAFNRHHYDHSPAVRRGQRLLMWSLAVLSLEIAVAVAFAANEPAALALGVVAAIVCVFLVPSMVRRQVDRQARKLYGEGANKDVIGPHELELVGGDLVERTRLSESRTRLEAVERVISAGGYTFIYVSAITAHVIPHDAVSEGEYEKFVEILKQRMSAEPAERGIAAAGGRRPGFS
jgi:hypothetical protein